MLFNVGGSAKPFCNFFTYVYCFLPGIVADSADSRCSTRWVVSKLFRSGKVEVVRAQKRDIEKVRWNKR